MVAASGKRWVTVPAGASSGLPYFVDETTEDRAGPGHRDLLADDGADEQLETVGMARHPQPRPLPHQRPQHRVARQGGVDRHRVGIEVEEPTGPGHGRGEVPEVVESERARSPRRARA